MANGTSMTAPTVRGTAPRESFSIPIIPVDEKRFESEIRRTDSAVADEKKNREKFETRIEKAVNDLGGEVSTRFEKVDAKIDGLHDSLRSEMSTRFEKVNARIDGLRSEMNTRFEKVDVKIDGLRDSLRSEMSTRFEKMEAKTDERFNRLEDRLWWIFGAVVLSILVPVILKYL